MIAVLEGSVAAFFGSFLQYLIEALILAGVAFLGIIVGKKARARKNQKLAAAEAAAAESIEESGKTEK
ncbi:MAG: hypothetical protein IJJ13_04445 [Lachnospiraceae bacterium]|nr:hypothetical protein [Lachnospiraceae bacterium]